MAKYIMPAFALLSLLLVASTFTPGSPEEPFNASPSRLQSPPAGYERIVGTFSFAFLCGEGGNRQYPTLLPQSGKRILLEIPKDLSDSMGNLLRYTGVDLRVTGKYRSDQSFAVAGIAAAVDQSNLRISSARPNAGDKIY